MLGLAKYTSKQRKKRRVMKVSKINHLQPYKFKILRTLLVGNAPSQKKRRKNNKRTNLFLTRNKNLFYLPI